MLLPFFDRDGLLVRDLDGFQLDDHRLENGFIVFPKGSRDFDFHIPFFDGNRVIVSVFQSVKGANRDGADGSAHEVVTSGPRIRVPFDVDRGETFPPIDDFNFDRAPTP